mgnify:CR=1 FL=1
MAVWVSGSKTCSQGGVMPNDISLYHVGVWFAVGFFTGAGWALGAWLVGRVLR